MLIALGIKLAICNFWGDLRGYGLKSTPFLRRIKLVLHSLFGDQALKACYFYLKLS